MAGWTFLTNHAHVLVVLSRDPESRLRDMAEAVGITERAASRIMSDLVAEGYVVREREGRRNRYTLDAGRPLRHPIERDHAVGDLLGALATPT